MKEKQHRRTRIGKFARRVMAFALSIAVVGSTIQVPIVTTKAEDSNATIASSGSALTENTGGSIPNAPKVTPLGATNQEMISSESYEYYDLGAVETSAIPMSFFGLSDGTVSLIDGTATKWIDRLDLTD